VFSRTLTTSGWNNTQIFRTDVPDTVARLKRDSAKDIYLFGSADLAASLIPHRLIDEFRIALNPLLLGALPAVSDRRKGQAEAAGLPFVVEWHRDPPLRAQLGPLHSGFEGLLSAQAQCH
jgi:riboflavin biosynthesis pyrimidine reductase